MARLSVHNVKSVQARQHKFAGFDTLTLVATANNGNETEFELFSDIGPITIEWLPTVVHAPAIKEAA